MRRWFTSRVNSAQNSLSNSGSNQVRAQAAQHDLDGFRTMVAAHQPHVRCCAVLPSRPDSGLSYEYLPEEEVSAGKFAAITAMIHDNNVKEVVDWAQLQCASGGCPI